MIKKNNLITNMNFKKNLILKTKLDEIQKNLNNKNLTLCLARELKKKQILLES